MITPIFYFKIPQDQYRAPVRTAVETLRQELDDVLVVVLYGSVARGEADRRSDIDLWVLVCEDRNANQREATRVCQDLEAVNGIVTDTAVTA